MTNDTREHVVKCWPEYWDAINAGMKTFDVRKNDRDYECGDKLSLARFDPNGDVQHQERHLSSLPTITRCITYVLNGGQFGIEPGHVVLGLSASPARPAHEAVAFAIAEAAARDVLAERRRQVEREGWTPSHDDGHANGEMAQAAGCYAIHAGLPEATQVPKGIAPQDWPWGAEWWKPKDRRRDLVRAGALILAEIERLDRARAALGDVP